MTLQLSLDDAMSMMAAAVVRREKSPADGETKPNPRLTCLAVF